MTAPIELALRGYPPATRPPVLSGAAVQYRVEDLPIGRMLLAARPDGTLLASFFTPDDAVVDAALARIASRISPRVLRGGRGLEPALRQLSEFLAGRRRVFDLPVDPVLATDFQRAVLDRLAAQVVYGHTTSYGTLAASLGRPRAARAVGAALGANPLCVVLPCHRVVSASGDLTGYAGGMPAKRWLLDLEAAGTPPTG